MKTANIFKTAFSKPVTAGKVALWVVLLPIALPLLILVGFIPRLPAMIASAMNNTANDNLLDGSNPYCYGDGWDED